jgi:DNA-binding response OmpR family regulator
MTTIMVVDDEINTRLLMEKVLKREGFEVILAANGKIAISKLEKHKIDLAIIDIMMPVIDGYHLTEYIKKIYPNLPIIMVTAKETIEDKTKGFHLGIDDYMVKPISFDELVLRIYALLRRANISTKRKIVIKNTTLDYDTLTVTTPDHNVELSKKEFLLLFHLLSYPGKIFTRQQLMENVWDMNTTSDDHTVDVHINRLRNKFKDNNDFEIVTIRGLGYKAIEK